MVKETLLQKRAKLRADLKAIADIIPESARVLDIGCGDGELLDYLVHEKNVDGSGIELDREGVRRSLQRGLTCIQGDANTDLEHYPDNCFDYTISSNMLQATINPKTVLSEMLRVSLHVVVSFPNFGYWYNRLYLLTKGRMPVSETLSYEWYETPNIHFCTIKDFMGLCQELDCVIDRAVFLSPDGSSEQKFLPNLLSDQGVFFLRKL